VGLQALVTLLQNTVLFYKVIKITYISVASKKNIIGISMQVLKTGNASSNGRRKVPYFIVFFSMRASIQTVLSKNCKIPPLLKSS
jgi:hypothetical protein